MTLFEKIKDQAWTRMPVVGRWILYPTFIFMATMLIYALGFAD